MKNLFRLFAVLLAGSAAAQPVSNRGVTVRDEGAAVGFARTIDFTGSLIGCTISGSVVTCAVGLPTNLVALNGLTSAADKIPYWTGSGTAANADFTAAGRSMVGATSATVQTALLDEFTGDSGAGGLKGLVKAPSAGDALKFLRGDKTWQTVDTTITHGVTARSGCVAGGISRSTSNLEDCGAGLTYASGVLTQSGSTNAGTGANFLNASTGAAASTEILFGEADSASKYGLLGYYNNSFTTNGAFAANTAVLLGANIGGLNLVASYGSSIGTIRMYTGGYAATNERFRIDGSGATRIGDASLGSTVVPLTVRLGTGSTANPLEIQNAAGTVLSSFNSGGRLIMDAGASYTTTSTLKLTNTGTGGNVGLSSGFSALALMFNDVHYGGFASTGWALPNAAKLNWLTGDSIFSGTSDLTLMKCGTACLQIGSTITSGSAINQTFRSHNATTGTNISGGNLTIVAPGGTGSSTGGTIAFQTAPVLLSGTTAQTPVDRMIVNKSGAVYMGSYDVSAYPTTSESASLVVGAEGAKNTWGYSLTVSSVLSGGVRLRSNTDAGGGEMPMFIGAGSGDAGYVNIYSKAVIGASSLGSTIVPLTSMLGTGSTASVFEMKNSAGTVLSRFGSAGQLLVGENPITGTTVAATINNGTSTGNILNLQDNGTNVFTVADGGAVTASGNFGIGTTPTVPFHIVQNANTTSTATMFNTNTGLSAGVGFIFGQSIAEGSYGGLYWLNNSHTGGNLFNVPNSYIVDGSGTGGLLMAAHHASGFVRFATGGFATGNERARITSTGLFGIMTTAPDKALEINSATGDNLRLTYNDANGSAANYADFATSSSGDLTITPSAGPVRFNSLGIQLVTGAKPTCDLTTRGTQFYVAGGAGVADTMEVCAKAASDAYAWYPMATIP